MPTTTYVSNENTESTNETATEPDTATQTPIHLEHFAEGLAPIRTTLAEIGIPIPETPPPPTPRDADPSPVPSAVSPDLSTLIEQISSGDAVAQAGLNLAQMLHPFYSGATPHPSSSAIQPYVRAMFAGRQRFEALRSATATSIYKEADKESRRSASVPFDWSVLNQLEFEAGATPRARAPTLPPLPPESDAEIPSSHAPKAASPKPRAPTLPGLSPMVFRRQLQEVFEVISEDLSHNGKHNKRLSLFSIATLYPPTLLQLRQQICLISHFYCRA